MSYRPIPCESLRGPEGELVFVRLQVGSRVLEDALEVLAQASFPVNPEIRHGHPWSWVEFPAYDANVEEVRGLLETGRLGEWTMEVTSALSALR